MTKEKFRKIYANLPVPERSQIIALVDGKSYSWDRAFDEIEKGTKLGEKILKKIEDLGII